MCTGDIWWNCTTCVGSRAYTDTTSRRDRPREDHKPSSGAYDGPATVSQVIAGIKLSCARNAQGLVGVHRARTTASPVTTTPALESRFVRGSDAPTSGIRRTARRGPTCVENRFRRVRDQEGPTQQGVGLPFTPRIRSSLASRVLRSRRTAWRCTRRSCSPSRRSRVRLVG